MNSTRNNINNTTRVLIAFGQKLTKDDVEYIKDTLSCKKMRMTPNNRALDVAIGRLVFAAADIDGHEITTLYADIRNNIDINACCVALRLRLRFINIYRFKEVDKASIAKLCEAYLYIEVLQSSLDLLNELLEAHCKLSKDVFQSATLTTMLASCDSIDQEVKRQLQSVIERVKTFQVPRC